MSASGHVRRFRQNVLSKSHPLRWAAIWYSFPSHLVPGREDPMGGTRGSPLGREEGPGGPLWNGPPAVSFPHFFSAKRNGVARRRNAPVLFPSRPQAASLRPPANSPLVIACRPAVPSPPAGLFLCRQRKRRKKPPKETYSEAVSFGIFPRRPRGLRPLEIPQRGFTWDGGRGTRDEGQDGNTDCRVASLLAMTAAAGIACAAGTEDPPIPSLRGQSADWPRQSVTPVLPRILCAVPSPGTGDGAISETCSCIPLRMGI